MAIRVALHHRTRYGYDRPVSLAPHLIRLRPAPHCRTPIISYSLKLEPKDHFINWQQDPYGNHQARFVFPKPTDAMTIDVDLIAEMPVINPFDFFVEEYAEKYPFKYEEVIAKELNPYFERKPIGPLTQALVDEIRADVVKPDMRVVDLLVAINLLVHKRLKYIIRMEPGVQTAEETLQIGIGSCRDFSWLMVTIMRELGLAARFVSGYSIQLVADVKALDGPSGVEQDCCDLHAWAEAYIPGAGWIGLDATSSLLTGEGHIPLACTADPLSAAPVTGSFGFNPRHEGDRVEETFKTEMTVRRVHEDPRVTKPYTPEVWTQIDNLGEKIDRVLKSGDVRLTMGGEPTFVSIDDMDGPEWNTDALGKDKRRLSGQLVRKLHKIFAPGGLLHFGQGKWYPGEQLPRWALAAWWRKDGEPIWEQPELFAADDTPYGFDEARAERFIRRLAELLEVNPDHAQPAFEDAWYYLWKERRLPANVDPFKSKLKEPMERKRLARVFEQGLDKTVGYCLPLSRWHPSNGFAGGRWISGAWTFRPERMYLIPGDSPMGYRLPLESLPWLAPELVPQVIEQDVMEDRPPLPSHRQFMLRGPGRDIHDMPREQVLVEQTVGEAGAGYGSGNGQPKLPRRRAPMEPAKWSETELPQVPSVDAVVRTALCVEPRNGALHVFMPPARYAEDYLDLVAAIEQTAAELDTPVFIEGYAPPHDYRLEHIKVTPDPGVIEVNMHPASTWTQLARQTNILYDEARTSRLGTEKFMLDGRHSGTGGGNHVVLGGPTPTDSPFLRRPDLLRSLVGYWHNHPSLSYLFSGLFIGPTSQAPRADEGRSDALYEMQIAFQQIPDPGHGKQLPPWLVDRTLRNILTDITGNTHRAEFCIDKLFSPDSSTGRLGLVEFRAFEMPPHWQMSMTQQLLLRALVARFWSDPYGKDLVNWGTALHGRYLLPHFLAADLEDVIGDLNDAGYTLDASWFSPHVEFRFPRIGSVAYRNVELELRTAIEPWNVMGEEGAPGGTVRFVDSSVERLQVKVRGLVDTRHVITCNRRRVPLHPTGVAGEYVAGVRYRAWQPPSCLHPTIPVHSPLIFDVLDTWSGRSIGGCTYHVSHPAGRNFETFPVNAYEAESRRYARFQPWGHSPGRMEEPVAEENPAFPYILDLRRS